MYRRITTATMAFALSLSAVNALHAAPRLQPGSASEGPQMGKMISFKVRNDSKGTLVVKSGEQQFTIEAGKTQDLKLQEGAELINVNGSEKSPAGSLLTKVHKQLQGNTLAIS